MKTTPRYEVNKHISRMTACNAYSLPPYFRSTVCHLSSSALGRASSSQASLALLDRDQIDTLVASYAMSPSSYGEHHLLPVFTSFACSGYRYGSDSYRNQGQEKDDEVKGKGNNVNYTYRMHDPRLGRFFAVDPLAYKYPYNSSYAFSENNVIHMVEMEGLEKAPPKVHYYNMVRQDDGGYKPLYSHSHSKLVIKTDNAILKEIMFKPIGYSNMKIPSGSVDLGKSDYGVQPRTTDVYTYWNQGKIAKQVVVTSSGLIDSPEGMIGTGNARQAHAIAQWQANSSGAVTSASIAEPFVEMAHSGLSGGLQKLGVGETAANNTASGLLLIGSVALGNKAVTFKSNFKVGLTTAPAEKALIKTPLNKTPLNKTSNGRYYDGFYTNNMRFQIHTHRIDGSNKVPHINFGNEGKYHLMLNKEGANINGRLWKAKN